EHVVRRSLPARGGTPESALLDEGTTYDAGGRVVTHWTAWGGETAVTYYPGDVEARGPAGALSYGAHEPPGRVGDGIDKMGGVTSYGYGPFGVVNRVQAPDGTVTSTVYDAWGRPVEVDDPDRGASLSRYDGFGDLVRSVDALERAAELSYDGLGRRVQR